jgi:lysophospholipase L1-like esterase
LPRQFAKPASIKRVALLGDSLIEEVQVPFEKTAGSLLEQKLNASLQHTPKQSEKWEVLNFGISSYGVGQYLLTYEEYAKKYSPDYVAIFVAYFHMARTVNKYERGAFPSTKEEQFWVRPVFAIENDRLVRLPAEDFGKFVKLQEELIKDEFSGQRMRKKTQLITIYQGRILLQQIKNWGRRFYRKYIKITPTQNYQVIDSEVLKVNLKVIEVLGEQVKNSGAHLIVIDASQYFGDQESVSNALKKLSTENGFGYIPLYDFLLKANANGISTRWAHDGHFNEAGNEILANTLYDWITQNSSTTTIG